MNIFISKQLNGIPVSPVCPVGPRTPFKSTCFSASMISVWSKTVRLLDPLWIFILQLNRHGVDSTLIDMNPNKTKCKKMLLMKFVNIILFRLVLVNYEINQVLYHKTSFIQINLNKLINCINFFFKF